MNQSPLFFILLLLCMLSGCSTQPDPVRLAPSLSGGWRKDNIMVIYQNQYPATQMTQMLISNGLNGWEKIDFKYKNGQIFDILSQSQTLIGNDENSQRKVKSYLSLQLNPDQSVKTVAYWYDEQPAVWALDKLDSYKKLFTTSQQQVSLLKENKQRLWLGELNLVNNEFSPCAYQQTFSLSTSDEFLAANLKNWQKMASQSKTKQKLWIALIGSTAENGDITLAEQLMVQPSRPSNCLILKPIGKP